MAIPTLEDFEDSLQDRTLAILGDTVTYAIGGSNPTSIKAMVNHSTQAEGFGGVQVTVQEITVEVSKADVPSPSQADRITLPKLSNLVVSPTGWDDNAAGDGHIIQVAKVRA